MTDSQPSPEQPTGAQYPDAAATPVQPVAGPPAEPTLSPAAQAQIDRIVAQDQARQQRANLTPAGGLRELKIAGILSLLGGMWWIIAFSLYTGQSLDALYVWTTLALPAQVLPVVSIVMLTIVRRGRDRSWERGTRTFLWVANLAELGSAAACVLFIIWLLASFASYTW